MFDPVSWKYSARQACTGWAVVYIKAGIEQVGHVDSQHSGEGGPIPTSFKFTPSEDYERIGKVEEKSKVEKLMDPNFGIEVAYFSNEAIFEQRIRLKKPAATVKGVLEFMVCDDQRCLPPTEVEFSIKADRKTVV